MKRAPCLKCSVLCITKSIAGKKIILIVGLRKIGNLFGVFSNEKGLKLNRITFSISHSVKAFSFSANLILASFVIRIKIVGLRKIANLFGFSE